MGRIKTVPVKRVTHELMASNRDKFTSDFEKNKQILNTMISTPSKKLRNVIAGYITRLVRKGDAPKKPGPSSESYGDVAE